MGGLIACRLLESSADLHDVRDCLGHTHITTTSRYVRSTPVRGLPVAGEALRFTESGRSELVCNLVAKADRPLSVLTRTS